MQSQQPVCSGQPGTREENLTEPAMRGSSPFISDLDQEFSSLERNCTWFEGCYTRQKQDLEEAAQQRC